MNQIIVVSFITKHSAVANDMWQDWERKSDGEKPLLHQIALQTS